MVSEIRESSIIIVGGKKKARARRRQLLGTEPKCLTSVQQDDFEHRQAMDGVVPKGLLYPTEPPLLHHPMTLFLSI